MRAAEATLLAAKIQRDQEALAEKHLSKHLKKVFKLVDKAIRSHNFSTCYQMSPFLCGYDYYWDHLCEILVKELACQGYQVRYEEGNDVMGIRYLIISWDPPPSRDLDL